MLRMEAAALLLPRPRERTERELLILLTCVLRTRSSLVFKRRELHQLLVFAPELLKE